MPQESKNDKVDLLKGPRTTESGANVVPGHAVDRAGPCSLIQGSLDITVLQTLASMGSLHGYGGGPAD